MQLLRRDINKRLGFKGALEIKKHPWFKGIDWQMVLRREQVMESIEPIEGKPIKEETFADSQQVYNKITGWDFNGNHIPSSG
jgi:hypothetical protein